MSQPTVLAETAVREDRRTARALRAVIGRAIYARGLSALRGLVILPLITQSELGIFRYTMTMQSYVLFLALGATTALGVEYPVKAAAGDDVACKRLSAMAFASTLSGSALALVYLLIVLFHAQVDTPMVTVVLAAMGAAAVLQNYVAISFRVEKRFSAMARNDAIVDTLCFLGALAGVYWFGVRGLLFATLASPVMAILLGLRYLSPKILSHVDTSDLRGRLRTNLSYLVASALTRVVSTIDVVVLGLLMGPRDARFGAYALGMMVANLVVLIMNAISQVQAVELLSEHGRNQGRDGKQTVVVLEELVLRDALLATFLAMSVGSGTAVGIHLFAPQHASVVPYLGIFLSGAVLARWREYPLAVMYATQRLRTNNLIAFLSSAAILAIIMVTYFCFEGALTGYALAPVAGCLIYGVAGLRVSQRALAADTAPGTFLPRLVLVHLPLCGFVAGFLSFEPQWAKVASAVASFAMYVVLMRLVFPGAFTKAMGSWLGRRSTGSEAAR